MFVESGEHTRDIEGLPIGIDLVGRGSVVLRCTRESTRDIIMVANNLVGGSLRSEYRVMSPTGAKDRYRFSGVL